MKHRDIILYGVYSDLRTEVARRFLGFLWWILEPVMYMGAFYIVFGLALGHSRPGYVPLLLSGMVAWKWFDGSVRQASNAIQANAGLIQQIHVPKYVFALIPVLSNTFKFLIILTLLILSLLVAGYRPSLEWLALPVLILNQLLFIIGFGFLLAAVLPFVPDLRQVVDNFLMLMMFMSGVFFSIHEIPASMAPLLNLNPMTVMITAFRDVLLHNQWPAWGEQLYVLSVAIPFLLLALWVLHRNERKYPKLLF